MMVKKPKDDSEQPKPSTQNMSNRVIKIFPNPTHGDLLVEMSGANPKEELRIQQYTAQGVVMENKQVTEGSNPQDLSSYPDGVYILRIVGSATGLEYKIIKK
jgi:Secretion system C-terminal sorting domain